jgi:hypothetical protein
VSSVPAQTPTIDAMVTPISRTNLTEYCYIPESERPAVLADALAAARTITDPYRQAQALTALAPHLPEPERPAVLADALTAARTIIGDPHRQTEVLMALAPHLPDNLLPDALAATLAIPDPFWQARALTALTPHLSGDRLADALAAARAITHPYGQAQALAALAPHLPEPERPAVLADALTAAGTMTEPYGWGEIIAAVVEASSRMGFLTWAPPWRAAFAGAAIQGRASLIDTLAAAAEVIARFGGTEAVRASIRVLQDVRRWWP